MSNHRQRVNMPRFDNTSDEQPSGADDGRSEWPVWNREHLIQQFQGIDGSTRSEAESQIDAFERSFWDISPGSMRRREMPGDSTE